MSGADIPFDSIASAVVLPIVRRLEGPGAPGVAAAAYHHLPQCPSTNTFLKEIAGSSPTGTVAVTDDQTMGRGRLGRTWLGRPGQDLAFSVLLRPALAAERAHLLALATGVAVAEVLEEEFGLGGQVALKWPNDVLLAGKKVCGILLEGSLSGDRLSWVVAGIGVNVNGEPGRMVESLPPDLAAEWEGRPEPVSLKEFLGRAVPRAPLLAALLVRGARLWSSLDDPEGQAALLEGWRRRDALLGRQVEVFAGADRSEVLVRGEAAGIGPEGQLLVRPGAERAAGHAPAGASDGAARSGEARLAEVFAGDVSVRSI